MRNLATLVLLALWLPATLHCRLEAAGLTLPHHDSCAVDHAHPVPLDCKDDACPTVEEMLIKETAANPVVARDLVAVPDFPVVPACGAARFAEAEAPARHSPPPELSAGWQFVTRAAPPARAPNPSA